MKNNNQWNPYGGYRSSSSGEEDLPTNILSGSGLTDESSTTILNENQTGRYPGGYAEPTDNYTQVSTGSQGNWTSSFDEQETSIIQNPGRYGQSGWSGEDSLTSTGPFYGSSASNRMNGSSSSQSGRAQEQGTAEYAQSGRQSSQGYGTNPPGSHFYGVSSRNTSSYGGHGHTGYKQGGSGDYHTIAGPSQRPFPSNSHTSPKKKPFAKRPAVIGILGICLATVIGVSAWMLLKDGKTGSGTNYIQDAFDQASAQMASDECGQQADASALQLSPGTDSSDPEVPLLGGSNNSNANSVSTNRATVSDTDVSVFYYTYGDDYISQVRASLDQKLEEAGFSWTSFDSNNSQTQQNEQIETAIVQGTDLLIVNLVDTYSMDAAQNIVSQAEHAGIPVIFFNRSVDPEVVQSYDKAAYVGTDYEMAGHLQGAMIGEYLNTHFDQADRNGDGKISYIMLKGQEGNAEADARTQFAVEDANEKLTAEGHPELTYYKEDASTHYELDKDGAWSSAEGQNIMQNALMQYNDDNGDMIELVTANNDGMALGALQALRREGFNNGDPSKTIPVFGVDALEEAKMEIDRGGMSGTVLQDASGMADMICRISANLSSGSYKFDGIKAEYVIGDWRVNVPDKKYSAG